MLLDLALPAVLMLAGFSPQASPRPLWVLVADAAAPPVNPLAREPLYADIVARASSLKSRVEAYRTAPAAGGSLPGLDAFKADVAALSALDMQGHVDLAKRGTDGDLKCILKGISQDLPNKLADIEQASTADARQAALKEMFYLLRDNVEVITTPPTVESGKEGT